MTLSRLKGHHPLMNVVRIRGSSLSLYLQQEFGRTYQRCHEIVNDSLLSIDDESASDSRRNLSLLKEVLDADPIDTLTRNWLQRRLFDDGAFGEGMTRPLDESQVDSPVKRKVHATKNGASRKEKDLEARFRRLLDAEDIPAAFLAAREWFDSAEVGDNPDLLLMLADSEFNLSRDYGDIKGMIRARKHAERMSQDSGAIWGLILISRMKAMETDLQFMLGTDNVRFDVDLRRRAIEQALSFCYFSFRTGRSDWFVPAVWIAGALQDTMGLHEEAIQLHRRLLAWCPEKDSENCGVTLSNLVSFALSAKKFSAAKAYLRRLEGIGRRKWPIVDVFILLARADYDKAKHRFEEALKSLKQAEQLLQRRFDNDPWAQLPIIARMRSAIHNRLTTRTTT